MIFKSISYITRLNSSKIKAYKDARQVEHLLLKLKRQWRDGHEKVSTLYLLVTIVKYDDYQIKQLKTLKRHCRSEALKEALNNNDNNDNNDNNVNNIRSTDIKVSKRCLC